MKTTSMSLLVLFAGTTAALAAPRESADLVAINGGPIISFARQNDIGNTTISANFTGSDGGGAYTARSISMTGTIASVGAGSFFREACFLVTPPAGTPFIAQPINIGASGTGAPITNTVTVAMAGPVTTAGTWTFQAFDHWDDVVAGTDATWSALTVTLDDAAVAAPAIGAGPSATFTDIDSDGVAATPAQSRTWNNTTGGAFNAYRISGVVTALNTNPAANLNADLVTDIRVRVTTPGGAATTFAPVLANSRSSSTFAITGAFSGAVTGNWTLDFFENADIAGVVDNFVNSISIELLNVPAPAAENLGTLVTGTPATDTENLAAGQVKWYTFTTTQNLGTLLNSALEIDTVGSTAGATTGAGNTSLGLYTNAGAIVSADFLDGTGELARMSFGNSGRVADPAVGTDAAGVAYTGQDGAFLASGTYYLAVTAGNAVYGPAVWAVTNASALTGSVTVNINQKDNIVAPATPPTAIDLGTIGANNSPRQVIANVAVPGDIFWYKIATREDLTTANGRFLDIDTEGSTLAGTGTNPNDTEVGIYTSIGILVASDDDDGTGALSQVSIGPGAVARPAPGDGVAYNGRDGTFLPAGTYYIAAGVFNVNFNPAFGVAHTDSAITTGAAGELHVNISTNIPGRCSVADVGVVGGGNGQDNRLDNNDFVAFINLFFAQDPSADVGVVGGGPGSDGQWDNNDFVAFINFFFNDAANCTG